METSPYSIYIDRRPLRVVFLVDPQGSLDWFDRIFEYNQEKWGGRFNPIILTDGKTILERWWKLLKTYDPDFVKSFVKLEDDILKKIYTFINPITTSVERDERQFIRLEEDPLDILPTKENIKKVSQGLRDDEYEFIYFEFDDTTPDVVKKFIQRNFGYLEKKEYPCYHIEVSLKDVKKKVVKITTLESLNEALLDWGEWRTRYVFPIQICGLPNSFKESRYDFEYQKFGIVIGDSSEDLAYFWNRNLFAHGWTRTGITHIWIPAELAESEIIRPGLANFLNKYVGRIGNNNHNTANFVSFSLTEEKLKELSEKFNGLLRHPKTVKQFTEPQVPDYHDYHSIFGVKQGMELFRAHSEEEYLVLNEPEIEQGTIGGQRYMLDVVMQFRPERFSHIIGPNYLWRLPKRANLLSDLRMFNKAARVNEYGMFSVLMERRSSTRPDENTLIIKLPEDSSVFGSLICGERFDFYKTDQRERFLSRPFYTMGRSDKGMYLSGILSLFPDLYVAHRLFEERYWRIIFGLMSNQPITESDKRKESIINTLKKNIRRGRDFANSGEDINWLAEKVLSLTKSHTKQEVDLEYEDFLEQAKKEHAAFSTKENRTNIIFDEKDLKKNLSELLSYNVLLLGIRPKCPRCGYRIWYHINETEQAIICKGCGYEFSIDAEETWFYRLNSLVRSGFALHGTIPILLTLGQLKNDARSCFLFLPSQNLYTKNEEKDSVNLFRELDIVCIQDGKFIIGEVKQSLQLFDTPEFEKIGDIAEVIKPDEVIFSSLDAKPNQFVQDNINKLQERLKPLEIEVRWYPIHYWAFEPTPVR